MRNRFMKIIRIWNIDKKALHMMTGVIALLMWIGCAFTFKGLYKEALLRWISLAFLGFGAVQDLWEKEIDSFVWIFFFLFQFAAFITNERNGGMEIWMNIGFSFLLVALYMILRSHIGFADIMILISLPFGFNLHITAMVLLMSSVFVLITGVIFSMMKKIKIHERFPMIPMIYTSIFLMQIFGKMNG